MSFACGLRFVPSVQKKFGRAEGHEQMARFLGPGPMRVGSAFDVRKNRSSDAPHARMSIDLGEDSSCLPMWRG